MGTGIRAEVRVEPGATCLVARTAARTGTQSRAVRKSVNADAPDRSTVEFMLEGNDCAVDAGADLPDGVDPVFDYGDTTVYRYTSDGTDRCPCDCIETYDCPIADRYVRDGSVFLTFHAPDVGTLQDLVADLRETFPAVDVQRLLRSEGGSRRPRLRVRRPGGADGPAAGGPSQRPRTGVLRPPETGQRRRRRGGDGHQSADVQRAPRSGPVEGPRRVAGGVSYQRLKPLACRWTPVLPTRRCRTPRQ